MSFLMPESIEKKKKLRQKFDKYQASFLNMDLFLKYLPGTLGEWWIWPHFDEKASLLSTLQFLFFWKPHHYLPRLEFGGGADPSLLLF